MTATENPAVPGETAVAATATEAQAEAFDEEMAAAYALRSA